MNSSYGKNLVFLKSFTKNNLELFRFLLKKYIVLPNPLLKPSLIVVYICIEMYSSPRTVQEFKTWSWKLHWGLVSHSGAQGLKVETHEFSVLELTFSPKETFSPQFFWWQQMDWRYKLLVSSSQDLSSLRKNSIYAGATSCNDFYVSLNKFK